MKPDPDSVSHERRQCATLVIVFVVVCAVSGSIAGFLISPVAGFLAIAVLSWWLAKGCASVLKDLHAKEQDEITKRTLASDNAQNK